MNFDLYIFHLINNLATSSIFGEVVAVFFATYLFWILVGWFVAAFIWHKKAGRKEFIALVSGGVLGYIFNKLLSLLWFRPRPFVTEHLVPLIEKSVLSKSFPSDHAVAAFFVATLLTTHKSSWWWSYLLAFLVAFGRVAVGVHYPTDVLVGAIIGITFGILVSKIEKHIRVRV